MTRSRSSALAVLAGTLAGFATMALHPTGTDVLHSADAGMQNRLVEMVHVLALVGAGLLVTGAAGLTSLLARRDLAVAGFVFYALGSIAVMNAAVASGFIAPWSVAHIAEASADERVRMLELMHFAGVFNQGFAYPYVIFAGIAFVLWSAAMLRGRDFSRPIAVFGLVTAPVIVASVMFGILRLDIHGFGLVVLSHGVWMLWAALLLWRRNE